MKKTVASMQKASAKPVADNAARKPVVAPRTLAIDIGGTGIKALTLDPAGKPLNERTRIATPKNARPKDVIEIVRKLAKAQSGFERVSVGFPGVVKDGIVYTAPNLGKGWMGFDLRHALERKLKKPVRIANDADIQGLGCATGRGLELVITLGTGFGSVLFADGTRVHLELGHHPFRNGKTYEDELGERALKKMGRKKWNKVLQEAIAELQRTFNYDRLYIGGGNSRLVNFKLPAGVKVVSNEDGLLGGIALWRDAKHGATEPTPTPLKLPATPPRKSPAPAVSAKPAAAPVTRSARPAVTKAASVAAKVAAHSTKGVPSPTASTPPANGSPHPSGAQIKKDASGPSPAS
jgi:polyphosphate glucokinase